jgi:Putative polyhydroxyalkanoic acid system protein (PHA_gran_rgn)
LIPVRQWIFAERAEIAHVSHSLRIKNVRRSDTFPLELVTVEWDVEPLICRAIVLATSASRANLMSPPLVVSIPHRLGKQEATRRLKTGLANARTNYAQWLTIDEEMWSGDSLQFRVRALGQSAGGKVDVFDDRVQLEVTLPWLLGKFAEKLVPAIRKEGTLMLEKK